MIEWIRNKKGRKEGSQMIKNTGGFDASCEGGTVVVSLVGEIDHHNASSLRTGIDKLIYEKRPNKLILDLSKIDFMDSSGLGLIMGRFSLVRELGGELSVRNPNANVLKICKLAGMERLIRIEKSEKSKK